SMCFLSYYICSAFFVLLSAYLTFSTRSLHDALPIYQPRHPGRRRGARAGRVRQPPRRHPAVGHADRQRRQGALRHQAVVPGQRADRKSTRLNSSHVKISYAVFCLKKKKKTKKETIII